MDTAKRSLLRGLETVPVTPKVFDVLVTLVANRDRALSKEELLDIVWSGINVEEGALTQQVSLLRKALGDDPEHPKYIETVARYGFRFICPVTVEASRPEVVAIRTLAVLPLVDVSPDLTGDYFADGLTETLVSTLGKVRAVRVLGRTSTLRFRDGQQSIADIAKAFGIDGVVEGSICRVGSRLRADVRLIECATEFQRWAQTYERDAADVLIVQREIAHTVATEIGATITAAERAALAVGPSVDHRAHDACLRAYHHLNRETPREMRIARTWFDCAIERDSAYASAHAGLAHWYVAAALNVMLPMAEAVIKGNQAALRALDCDPASAEAFAAVGRIAFLELKLARAVAYLENAVRLDPTNERNCRALALYLLYQGRTTEALSRAEQAVAADPLSPGAHIVMVRVHYVAGHHELALRSAQEALVLDPHIPQSEYYHALVLIQMGELKSAARALRRAKTMLHPKPHPAVLSALAHVRARQGSVDEAENMLTALCESMAAGKATGLDVALVHLALNRHDDALAALESAVAQRDATVLSFAVHPMLEAIRDTPRFQALLLRVASLAAA